MLGQQVLFLLTAFAAFAGFGCSLYAAFKIPTCKSLKTRDEESYKKIEMILSLARDISHSQTELCKAHKEAHNSKVAWFGIMMGSIISGIISTALALITQKGKWTGI
jgi:uncharacterized membrane protein YjjP (DUF1212 family)